MSSPYYVKSMSRVIQSIRVNLSCIPLSEMFVQDTIMVPAVCHIAVTHPFLEAILTDISKSDAGELESACAFFCRLYLSGLNALAPITLHIVL